MKLIKCKTYVTIAVLTLAIAVSLIVLPAVNAQATMQTYAYIGAVPNPVGVGQEVLLHVGITKELYSSEMGWEGLSVTITKPDGTTETISNIRTDATGGTGVVYVPTMVGNYTLQSHFPQQEITATKRAGGFFTSMPPIGTIMLASSSEKLTLVVQEEPAPPYPGHPLPTEYWTRPIDAQKIEWWVVAGQWLEGTPRNNYVIGNDEAPETAHILWAKAMTTGGLVGGSLSSLELNALTQQSFEIGDAYEGKFGNRFILAGKLYYDKYANPDPYHEIVCVDIRTGEQLWSRVLLNNLTITRGQLMYWDTYDYHGVYDYLWCTGNAGTRAMLGISNATSSWHAFDPFTGDYVYTLHTLPTATATSVGPKGEILIYTVSLTAGWMTMWNSTNIPALYASTVFASMGWGQWRAMGKIVNATAPHGVTFNNTAFNPRTLPLGLSGYQWNVTIPRGLPGSVTAVFEGDRIIGGSITTTAVYLWGLSLKPGQVGQLLFNKTWNAPAYWAAGNLTVSGAAAGWMRWSQEDKVGVMWIRETREHYGFSIETGDYLWGPTKPQNYWDAIEDSPADVRCVAYGKLYCASVSGVVYCYDIKTGERLWTYEAIDPYNEYLFATTWWMRSLFITDGKLYVGHYEHSPIDPRPRGAPFICLNATTGEVIFRVNGLFRQTRWGGRAVIGDSVIVTQDTYDQRIYAIGKGPSATTVTAPDIGVSLGKSVLIRGMVTDVSPGTKSSALQLRFPNGVPAVADESMSDWMLYVYKQFEKPADVKGVEVVISVLDPNNNCYEVARATTDASGFFSATFTPPVPGKYTVIATFAGSKAYYGSSAETALYVEEAPPPTPPPTPPPASIADIYFIPAVVGIIVAIVVVGLVIILMLRKR
ncbi:MAG: hypothetical protein QXD70_02310 [Candidatus Bathyarchaeia archaeon]